MQTYLSGTVIWSSHYELVVKAGRLAAKEFGVSTSPRQHNLHAEYKTYPSPAGHLNFPSPHKNGGLCFRSVWCCAIVVICVCRAQVGGDHVKYNNHTFK